MSEKIKVLLSEEEVDSRIKQIAAKVSKDYAGKEIHLICVLKGGVFLPVNLQRESQCRFLLTLCLYPVMVMTPSPAVL